VLFSEYILSPEFDMGHLSLEDIYPDDVEKYGHLRVGMTDLYVKDNHAIYGVVTLGVRIPRHPATQPTNIRPPVPRSSGQAVGAQRRRFALLV
jgi:hypothetical protein